MRIGGNYNNINTNNRATDSRSVQNKQCKCESQNKQKNIDTFERSTPEDIKYANYADISHQYAQAVYASLYNQKKEQLTPNDELLIESKKDRHSIVENTSASCPTHNNETHSYNQQEKKDSNSGDDDSYTENNDDTRVEG